MIFLNQKGFAPRIIEPLLGGKIMNIFKIKLGDLEYFNDDLYIRKETEILVEPEPGGVGEPEIHTGIIFIKKKQETNKTNWDAKEQAEAAKCE
jgi:hypothetical protein